MPGHRRRRRGGGPWDRPWGHGRGDPFEHRHHEDPPKPEEVAEQFAAAVETVATKVGSAIERAFEPRPDGSTPAQQTVEGVGRQVASAIEQAIGKVGEALPKPDPLRKHRRLLHRRDQANARILLFALLGVGITATVVGVGGGAWPGAFIVAAVFGILTLRNVLWKAGNRTAVARAERALGESDPVCRTTESEPMCRTTETEIATEPMCRTNETSTEPMCRTTESESETESGAREAEIDDPQLRSIENEAQQVLELLGEAGGSRESVRGSVEATVAKARELAGRRIRLERMFADPDLADLDERMQGLDRRIEETADEETREVYRRTLDQLRAQSESLADVRVMMERLDAYLNASLQSLRTIHIDLLRLQTNGLEDPDRTLDDISARAGTLGMEIKSVREVVEEVQRSRRAQLATTRQL